jgi:ATP-dependent helicase/nuclease subunit A
LTLSHTRAPYEFFEGVLSTPLSDGTSHMKLFYQRLSMEVADPIDAFLARALAHQRREAPSLQHFVQSFMSDTAELKREFDGRQNEVRVMTVYGAKGLEAPIVILPDTSQMPDTKNALDSGLLARADGTFARLGSKDDTPPNLLAERELRLEKLTQEYLRLFYVALTRAKTRLLICGYFSGARPKSGAAQKAPEGCWHDLAQKALEGLDAREIETPFNSEEYTGYAYGSRPKVVNHVSEAADRRELRLPDWAVQATPPLAAKPSQLALSPSTLLARGENLNELTRSPISQSPQRFLRGNLIHKLLELLPEVPQERRAGAMVDFLSAYDMPNQDEKDDIAQVVTRVLEHPDFAQIFMPGSHAEISLAGQAKGLPKSLRLNAQIDRLCVTDTQVFIVDYKSNRPPPETTAQVSKLYLGQMAAYRELAKSAYGGREIVCALLWTENAHMMVLPDDLLDKALEDIRTQYIS